MKQLIIVRKDLIDQYGYVKMMVQVAHASTKIITDSIYFFNDVYVADLTEAEYKWTQDTYKKIITYVKSEDKLLKIFEEIKDKYPSVLIKDHALTVYPEPMYTCVGIMGEDKDMNEISKKYRLQLLK